MICGRIFQESEKFIKLYISELRKALKVRKSQHLSSSIRADNFLGLIQVSSELFYLPALMTFDL